MACDATSGVRPSRKIRKCLCVRSHRSLGVSFKPVESVRGSDSLVTFDFSKVVMSAQMAFVASSLTQECGNDIFCQRFVHKDLYCPRYTISGKCWQISE